MSRLAREELRHFEQVTKLMRTLRIAQRRLSPSRYADGLRRLVAKTEPRREVDLMICGAVIEARSCERFAALSPIIGAPVGGFFGGLHAAEARHYAIYVTLAQRAAARADVDLTPRLAAFAAAEAELVTAHDPLFRFHSGVP
jgi:tRNA-(ms[2]io[6]A)-hydroxylase